MLERSDEASFHAKRVLVVECDRLVRETLSRGLSRKGYDVHSAVDALTANDVVNRETPNIAIIGVELPVVTGLDLLRVLRDDPRTSRLPVLMLATCPNDQDKVRGFEAGADDYIEKPFSMVELLARLQALLRRNYRNGADGLMSAGGLVLDSVSHRVWFDKQIISLNRLEFRLLSLLMAHPDQPMSREVILDRVWNDAVHADSRRVDGHVNVLRRVLKVYGCENYIQTVWGLGYKFSAGMGTVLD